MSTNTLCPWEFLILCVELPSRAPGPKPWRQDSSAHGWGLPQGWTRGGAAAPLFLKDGEISPGLVEGALKDHLGFPVCLPDFTFSVPSNVENQWKAGRALKKTKHKLCVDSSTRKFKTFATNTVFIATDI